MKGSRKSFLLMARAAVVAVLFFAGSGVQAQNPSPQQDLYCWGCVSAYYPPFSYGWRCQSGMGNGYTQCNDWEESPGWWSCSLRGETCGISLTDSVTAALATGDPDKFEEAVLRVDATELAPGIVQFKGCRGEVLTVLVDTPGRGEVLLNRR
jgi:hypothetical protein